MLFQCIQCRVKGNCRRSLNTVHQFYIHCTFNIHAAAHYKNDENHFQYQRKVCEQTFSFDQSGYIIFPTGEILPAFRCSTSTFMIEARVNSILWFHQFKPSQLEAAIPFTSSFLSYSISWEEVPRRQLLSQKYCIMKRTSQWIIHEYYNHYFFILRFTIIYPT